MIDLDELEKHLADIKENTKPIYPENTFALKTIELEEFCTLTDEKISRVNIPEIPLESSRNVIMIQDFMGNVPAIVSNTNKYIKLTEASSSSVVTNSDGHRYMDAGFMFDQSYCKYDNDGEVTEIKGLFAFYPFYHFNKRITAFYIGISRSLAQFIFVECAPPHNELFNIVLDDVKIRSLDDPITEDDRIIAANESTRFKTAAKNWVNLWDAIEYLNNLMYKTVDPNYMLKLIELNKALSICRD